MSELLTQKELRVHRRRRSTSIAVWAGLMGLTLVLLLVRLPLFIETAAEAIGSDGALTDPAVTEAATTVGAVGAIVVHVILLGVVAALTSLVERRIGPVVLGSPSGRFRLGVAGLVFALLVLGYGAKAGMIPLHSWLPDAHSQAPAPVSALMSGVLLPVAVYALIRYRVIAVDSLNPSFVQTLLLVMALASLTLATSLIIAQRDYKRLLPYSSIEHMSLIVIGLAIGTPLAIAASLLHILGHGLGKAVLFCSAGQVLQAEGTSQSAHVRGLLARRPVLAAVFGVGFLALLGLPPFSLFVSELGLARAAAADGLVWVIALALTMLVIVFVAITAQLTPMILGSDPSQTRSVSATGSTVPLILGLVVLAALGIVAWPVDQLLHAASLIAGTP